MTNAKGQGFWKGFVYGLVTPLVVGLAVTAFGTLVVLLGGRRQLGDGEQQ